VGDYESLSFLEAIRELSMKLGPENCLFIHVVYIPYLGASGEFKTKPAQNAVRELRGLGIVPDILIARSEAQPPKSILRKLSLFSGVSQESIALLPNAETIYQVPLTLEDTGIGKVITEQLGLKGSRPDLSSWQRVVKSALKKHKKTVKVGLIAKYVDNQDTYMCVFEALKAAAWANDVDVDIVWINAENLQKDRKTQQMLSEIDAIVVPGGFGERGLEGKIRAARYSLSNKVPYLGLCLGLQMAVIAAARNAGLADATTVELKPHGKNRVIDYMADQHDKKNTGGTMRLGNYVNTLERGTLARRIYGAPEVTERHRHRCECNNAYRDQYEQWGIRASGLSPDGHLVEVVEAIDHPFFISTQAHPEFRSRPDRPHPLFAGLIKAAL
jgi:CTP synthase